MDTVMADAMPAPPPLAPAMPELPTKKAKGGRQPSEFSKEPKGPVVLYENNEMEKFSDRPGSHPYLDSGLRLEHPFRGKTTAELRSNIYRPRQFATEASDAGPLFHLGPPPPDELPLSWAPAPESYNSQGAKYNEWHSAEFTRLAHESIVLYIPIELLPSNDAMHLADSQPHERLFMAAFHFINKALMTNKVGSNDKDGAPHRFKNQFDQSLAKIEATGEVLLRDPNTAVNKYILKHHKNEPRTPELLARVAASVHVREKLFARSNIVGVRMFLFIVDPKLNSSRALQKRLYRNQVEMGTFSPADIVEREERWERERKQISADYHALKDQFKAIEKEHKTMGQSFMSWPKYLAMKRAEQRPASASAVDPQELPSDQQQQDDGNNAGDDDHHPRQMEDAAVDPEAHERKKKEKIKALIEELAAAQVREDQGEIAALEAKIAKLSSAQEKGPSRQQMIDGLVLSARRLALKFEENRVSSKYPSLLFALKDRSGKFDSSTVFGSASSKRFTGREIRHMPEEERRLYSEKATGRTVSVVSITRMRDVLLALGAMINITNEKYVDECTEHDQRINRLRKEFYLHQNIMLDESSDLNPAPGRDHPYRPSDWLTFENMTVGWNLEKAGVCREQLNPSNYYISDTKEFLVPFPCLAWRLPSEKGFKSKTLANVRPFWVFGSLMELYAECERKYAKKMAAEELESKKRLSDADMLRGTNEIIDQVIIDPKKRARAKLEEERKRQMYEKSVLALEQATFDKKYTRSDLSGGVSASDRKFSSGAAPDHQADADKEKQEILVRDILGDATEDATKWLQRVKDMVKKCPEDEAALIRAYRKHQLEKFVALMRPDAHSTLYPKNVYGMNVVHSQHVKTLYEGNKDNPSIYFKFCGYQNLTYNSSLMAEWINRMNTIVGVTNSIHVLATMFFQMNVNAYYAQRAHGIHVIKIGAPGCGKSFMDAILKKIKLDGTCEDSIHMSDKSKLVEVPQDDRVLIKDEADHSITSDAAKSNSAQDYNAKMLTKAYLGAGGGTMGFSVFGVNADGKRITLHKEVSVRSNMTMNSNIYSPAKDGSIYDRLMRYIIVPTTRPVDSSLEIVRKALDPSLNEAATAMITGEFRGVDLIQFRTTKMISVGAAAQPNINDTLLHILKGIPKLEKYGISSDTSMRRITCMSELAKALTITMAGMRTFTNGPTVKRTGEVASTREWMESMMKEVRYQLYASQDITTYVLSQGYRQMIGDYEGFDVLFCIGKMQLGHRDDIFHDLFDREAYERIAVKNKDGTVTYKQGKKLFPFVRFESLHGKNRTHKELPQYVVDEDMKMRQWETAGWRHRKPKRSNDTDEVHNLRFYPAFLGWKQNEAGLTAEENQAKIDAVKAPRDPLKGSVPMPKAVRQSMNNGQPVSGAPPSMAGADPDQPQDQQHRSTGKPGGGGGSPAGGEIRIIDPNWIVHPKLGLRDAIQTAVRDRSSCSFSTDQMAEYAVRHICQDRKMLLPVLEWITDANEDLHFVKHRVGDQDVVQLRMTPFCQIMTIKTESLDNWTGQIIPPGDHLAISTMALYMFRPLAVLFKLLTSMEYEFTPKQTMLIDVPVPGFEGVHYTHTSHPRPGRKLRKSSCSIVTNSFMKTYLLEHTRTQYHLFIDKSNPHNKEFEQRNKDTYNKITEEEKTMLDAAEKLARMPETKKAIAELMDDDDDDDVGGIDAENNNKSKSDLDIDEDDSDQESARASKRKALEESAGLGGAGGGVIAPSKPMRRHIPAGFDNDHIGKQAIRMTSSNSQFYTRYHLHEEYERWLVQEYGKNIHKEGKPIQKKAYYPGEADARIELAVECAPQYQLTRNLFGGKRVFYPDDVVRDEKELRERDAPRNYQTAGSDYSKISREECLSTSTRFVEMLTRQRANARYRMEMKKKQMEPSDAVARALQEAAKQAQSKAMLDGKDAPVPASSSFIALGITPVVNTLINHHTKELPMSIQMSATKTSLVAPPVIPAGTTNVSYRQALVHQEDQDSMMTIEPPAAVAASEDSNDAQPPALLVEKRKQSKKDKHKHKHKSRDRDDDDDDEGMDGITDTVISGRRKHQ